MIGIIAEYNPFHNGHLYHINQVKKMFPNEIICVVLAGYFLNRGEVSIIDKWDKTQLALEYGVDMVVELPFMFASQAADIYAYGAIRILDTLKATYIVFGSECNDINYLKKLANQKENGEMKTYLKQGYNYPTALSKTKEMVSNPNDLLGVSYIKAIEKIHSPIIPLTIQRTNSYHDLQLKDNIASASSIRKGILERKDITPFVPKETLSYIQTISLEDYFIILKHQILTDDIIKYQTVDQALASKLQKNILSSHSIEELITKVKTKDITYNRIKRSLVHILCHFTKEEATNQLTYIRLLGFNQNGKRYLNKIKKELSIPLFSKYNQQMELDLRIAKIYSLITNQTIQKELKGIIIK